MVLICTRLKKRGKDIKMYVHFEFLLHNPIASKKHTDTNANQLEINYISPQQRNQSTASAPSIVMNNNQTLSVGENTSSISNQQVHKNISYRVTVLEQGVVRSTTESGYEDDENSLISNQAYEGNGESHYEDII